MAKPRNNFTESDHFFAYILHLNTKRLNIELKEADFKLIALSRRVKRTRGSWSRKLMNFDHIRDGGSQHGNAHDVYAEFKSGYEKNPDAALVSATSELEPVSEEARKLFAKLGLSEQEIPKHINNPKPIFFGVIGNGDIVDAAKLIDRGRTLEGFSESISYDVILGNEKYPPKLLTALAYKLASGIDIRGSDFEGGRGTPCFEILKNLGYEPIDKIPGKVSVYDRKPKDLGINMKNSLITSLSSKPFVIIAGGTGTGKTRAARLTASSITDKYNIEVVAVGADWTDNRPLLGFRNLLAEGGKTYIAPPALRIILKALENPGKPHFLILDEMNLSHVERYFADFLSSMESKEPLKLHDSSVALKTDDGITVPGKIAYPNNLFVIGTVNIDETTYMFSPKILDRAHVIEFKVTWDEIENGLEGAVPSELPALRPEQVEEFMRISRLTEKALPEEDHELLTEVLEDLHWALEGTRFVFAHRTARECLNFIDSAKALAMADIVEPRNTIDLIDLAILQKALPKLNGASGTLSKVLEELIKVSDKHDLELCKEKLESMSRQLKADQFVSFIQ
jgi:hypothetical protein